jgi:hypothetical protein
MMATPVQRWQSIGDALLNGTATQTQLLRLGRSFAYLAVETDLFNAMTNAQKAQYSLDALFMYLKKQVKRMDSEIAAATAATNATSAVDTEFAPVP